MLSSYQIKEAVRRGSERSTTLLTERHWYRYFTVNFKITNFVEQLQTASSVAKKDMFLFIDNLLVCLIL